MISHTKKFDGEVYLVGGAVRDKLMGFDPKDHDYVVVGGNEQSMLNAGFTQVGKDFPIFLHPETSEEYSLARKEREMNNGNKNFFSDLGRKITIEEDLSNRDLTINAMASYMIPIMEKKI